jgi:HEAT repeat protein
MLLFGKPNVKKMKERKDIEGLFKSLEYGDWRKPKDLEVRVAAAEALAELSDPSVINRLVEMLRHNQVPRATHYRTGEISE